MLPRISEFVAPFCSIAAKRGNASRKWPMKGSAVAQAKNCKPELSLSGAGPERMTTLFQILDNKSVIPWFRASKFCM